jgi:hypothetical protein
MKNAICCAATIVASIVSGLAQAPSGGVNFFFDRSTVPLWDFGGAYQFDQEIIGVDQTPLPLSYSLVITQSVTGTLYGKGTILVGVGNDAPAANYSVSGRTTGGGNTTKAKFTVRLSGQDFVAGVNTKFGITLNYVMTPPTLDQAATATATVEDGVITGLTVNNRGAGYLSPPDVTITDDTGSGAQAFAEIASDGRVTDIVLVSGGANYSDNPTITMSPPTGMTVTAKGRASFSSLGSGRIDSVFLMPAPVDGSWSIQMNIFPLSRLAGSGTILLPNGNTLQTSLTGSFAGNTARVRLNGTGSSRGNSVFLLFETTDGVPASSPDLVQGRVLGQAINATLKKGTK